MNPEGYVSYPLALALKKAGFDERCRHHYDIEDAPEGCYWEGSSWHKKNHNEDILKFSAPSLWQAQKWLRDIKRLSIEPYANIAVAWNYNIADLDNFAENVGGEASFPSYESALSAGIAAALELIEKKGE